MSANTVVRAAWSGAVLGVLTLCLRADAQEFTQFRVDEPNGVTRYSVPILAPDHALGDTLVFNPTVIEVGERLAMIYRRHGHGSAGSRLQLAFSEDGRTFVPDASNPVLVPDRPYDCGGCEDPRLVRFDATYYLTYAGNAGGGYDTQCLATSPDLVHWEKQGVVLRPEGWNAGQVKAGVIVPEKIGGKYVMYFAGQTQPWHTSLGLAVSDDLRHWSQPLDHPVMTIRADRFDSLGVEPGPTPLILPEGILLIYNGWNAAHLHRTGWVLFARDDPSKVIRRCDAPFIEPEFPYEIDGRHVFTFTEGAARFKGLWRFYYGAADKTIGLAEISDLTTLFKAAP